MSNIIKTLFILPILCSADIYQVQWIETIDNGYGDVAYDVDVDDSNNIIVTGVSVINSTQDIFTVKYDPAGTIVWADTIDYNNSTDNAQSVAVDRNNNILITGHTWFNGCKYLTIKLDSSGTMLWDDTLNTGNFELAWDVAIDSSNNVIITGVSHLYPCACVTVKYDPSGTLVWADSVYYGEVHSGNGVAVDNENNIIVASHCSFTPYQYENIVMLKYNSLGSLMQVDTLAHHNGGPDRTYDVAVDNSNNSIVVGQVHNSNFLVVKLNSSGAILWENTTYSGYANSVAVDSINNIVVAGYTYTSGSYGDFLIVKYDSLGTILWQDILDIGGYWDYAHGAAFDKEGNIIVTGSAAINSLHAKDYCTVKYEYVAGVTEEVKSIPTGNSNPITCIITGPLVLPESKDCRVFDIIGKEVIPSEIRPGIYFIEIEGCITSKVVKLR